MTRGVPQPVRKSVKAQVRRRGRGAGGCRARCNGRSDKRARFRVQKAERQGRPDDGRPACSGVPEEYCSVYVLPCSGPVYSCTVLVMQMQNAQRRLMLNFATTDTGSDARGHEKPAAERIGRGNNNWRWGPNRNGISDLDMPGRYCRPQLSWSKR